MSYYLKGTDVLDKYHEENSVSPNGTSEYIYTIPTGETWNILEFGGSASINQTEVQFYYSNDGGVSWINPYDNTTNRIRVIHLQNGLVGTIPFQNALKFTGNNGLIGRAHV